MHRMRPQPTIFDYYDYSYEEKYSRLLIEGNSKIVFLGNFCSRKKLVITIFTDGTNFRRMRPIPTTNNNYYESCGRKCITKNSGSRVFILFRKYYEIFKNAILHFIEHCIGEKMTYELNLGYTQDRSCPKVSEASLGNNFPAVFSRLLKNRNRYEKNCQEQFYTC